MRACPFCAEEIQDAAVVCKHCNRDIPAANTSSAAGGTTLAAPPKKAAHDSGSGRKRNSVGLLVLVLLVLAVLVMANSSNANSSPPPSGIVSAVSSPSVTNIAMDKELVIRAGTFETFPWQVSSAQPTCSVTGHIEVTDGGSKDVDVMVLAADDYQNFTNGHEFKVYFQSGKTTAVTLNATSGQPGPLYLVVSNAFSVVSDKTVKFTNVQAVCR